VGVKGELVEYGLHSRAGRCDGGVGVVREIGFFEWIGRQVVKFAGGVELEPAVADDAGDGVL